jgi:hypothetical protein
MLGGSPRHLTFKVLGIFWGAMQRLPQVMGRLATNLPKFTSCPCLLSLSASNGVGMMSLLMCFVKDLACVHKVHR